MATRESYQADLANAPNQPAAGPAGSSGPVYEALSSHVSNTDPHSQYLKKLNLNESLGIWYGTQAEYDALDPSLKVAYWDHTGTGYFEFHIIPDESGSVRVYVIGEPVIPRRGNISVSISGNSTFGIIGKASVPAKGIVNLTTNSLFEVAGLASSPANGAVSFWIGTDVAVSGTGAVPSKGAVAVTSDSSLSVAGQAASPALGAVTVSSVINRTVTVAGKAATCAKGTVTASGTSGGNQVTFQWSGAPTNSISIGGTTYGGTGSTTREWTTFTADVKGSGGGKGDDGSTSGGWGGTGGKANATFSSVAGATFTVVAGAGGILAYPSLGGGASYVVNASDSSKYTAAGGGGGGGAGDFVDSGPYDGTDGASYGSAAGGAGGAGALDESAENGVNGGDGNFYTTGTGVSQNTASCAIGGGSVGGGENSLADGTNGVVVITGS